MFETEIKQASKEHLISRIDLFKERPLDDITNIKPVWACGQHIERLYNRTLHPAEQEYVILYAAVEDIIKNSYFIDVDPFLLFGNGELSDYRVMKIIAHWEEKKHIDPPTIYDSCRNGKKLTFLDGRHRTIVAHHLNAKQIPVAMQTSDKAAIQAVIMLWDQPTIE